VTRFVKDRSPALTTLTADRSWTLATGAGVVVAVVAGLAGNRASSAWPPPRRRPTALASVPRHTRG
jgi:hypothetical protein